MGNIEISGNEIVLKGNLTRQTVVELFRNSPNFSGDQYVIDLGKIDKIDSSGLALLIYWKGNAKSASASLEFKNIPRKMKEIAVLGNLESEF